MKTQEELDNIIEDADLYTYERHSKIPDGSYCVVLLYKEEELNFESQLVLIKAIRSRFKYIPTKLDTNANLGFTEYSVFEFKNSLEQENFLVNILIYYSPYYNKLLNTKYNKIWKSLKAIRNELGLNGVHKSRILELHPEVRIEYNGLEYFNMQIVTQAVMEKRI